MSNKRVIEYKGERHKKLHPEPILMLTRSTFMSFFSLQKKESKKVIFVGSERTRTKTQTRTHHPETILFIYEFSQLKLAQ